MANVKELAQAQDDPRMGALKRRLKTNPQSQAQQDKNKEVIDDRKNMGY